MSEIEELRNALAEFDTTAKGRAVELRVDLSRLIIRRLRALGWSQKRLAQEAGLKESYVSRLIHAHANCTLEVVSRVVNAMGLRAQLAEGRPETPSHVSKVVASTWPMLGHFHPSGIIPPLGTDRLRTSYGEKKESTVVVIRKGSEQATISNLLEGRETHASDYH